MATREAYLGLHNTGDDSKKLFHAPIATTRQVNRLNVFHIFFECIINKLFN
jgi:hypothetical protein